MMTRLRRRAPPTTSANKWRSMSSAGNMDKTNSGTLATSSCTLCPCCAPAAAAGAAERNNSRNIKSSNRRSNRMPPVTFTLKSTYHLGPLLLIVLPLLLVAPASSVGALVLVDQTSHNHHHHHPHRPSQLWHSLQRQAWLMEKEQNRRHLADLAPADEPPISPEPEPAAAPSHQSQPEPISRFWSRQSEQADADDGAGQQQPEQSNNEPQLPPSLHELIAQQEQQQQHRPHHRHHHLQPHHSHPSHLHQQQQQLQHQQQQQQHFQHQQQQQLEQQQQQQQQQQEQQRQQELQQQHQQQQQMRQQVPRFVQLGVPADRQVGGSTAPTVQRQVMAPPPFYDLSMAPANFLQIETSSPANMHANQNVENNNQNEPTGDQNMAAVAAGHMRERQLGGRSLGGHQQQDLSYNHHKAATMASVAAELGDMLQEASSQQHQKVEINNKEDGSEGKNSQLGGSDASEVEKATAAVEPRQRRRIFNRILKKAEWNHLFVELSKVFLRYFLDLALKDIIGKQSGAATSSDTTSRKKLDAQTELTDLLKDFVKTAISNI